MSDDDVGPAAGVRSEETLVPAADSGEGETDFRPFDEVLDAFQLERPVMVVGVDGMPGEADRTTESDIPALSTKSLVCMGDFSSFVVKNGDGFVTGTVPVEKIERTPSGRYRCRTEDVIWISEEDQRFWQKAIADNPETKLFSIMVVEPIRPPCEHYVRQEAPFQHNASHSAFLRLCSARRTTEGAFMSVGDTGMFACSMREPRDLESEKRLDDFDARKIREGRERVYLPIAKAEAPPAPPASLGIFGPNT